MKTYAFIPARYGSRRFPGKPLVLIAGKPMVQHVYERTSACPGLAGVYVATDDERIARCVKDFGGRALMTRSDHSSGTDRICEAAVSLGLGGDDVVVNIQGDQPLFRPELVGILTAPFREEEGILMTTLMHPIRDARDLENPNHVKVVTDKRGFALYFSRCPIPFVREAGGVGGRHFKHLGVYAYRMDFLVRFTGLSRGVLEEAEKLEQLRALENGYRIRVIETDMNSLEVDVPDDVRAVEAALGTL